MKGQSFFGAVREEPILVAKRTPRVLETSIRVCLPAQVLLLHPNQGIELETRVTTWHLNDGSVSSWGSTRQPTLEHLSLRSIHQTPVTCRNNVEVD